MLHTRRSSVMFPVALSGTVSVNLPAVAATTFAYSTAVTVNGVQPGDTVTALILDDDMRTARILNGAIASDINEITLAFVNPASAANAIDYTVAYTVSPVEG